jgi:hypothetical protein
MRRCIISGDGGVVLSLLPVVGLVATTVARPPVTGATHATTDVAFLYRDNFSPVALITVLEAKWRCNKRITIENNNMKSILRS